MEKNKKKEQKKDICKTYTLPPHWRLRKLFDKILGI